MGASIKNIFSNGILVDIFVGKWTAERQLTSEDLGIDPKSLPKSFKLGQKFLIPPEIVAKFNHQDYLVRHLLESNSFEFQFGHARFLPKKLVVMFDEEFTKIKNDYDALVVDLVQNYTNYKMQMRTDFITAAKEAYTRLQNIPVIKDNLPSEDEYIEKFLERIEKDYPSSDSLFGKYNMSYAFYEMELPDLAQASINDVATENDKIRLLEETYKRKMRKEMESYAEKLASQNRERVQKVVDAMTSNLKRGAKYTEKTANMISEMIDSFINLDLVDDVKLRDVLVKFKATYIDGQTSAKIRGSSKLQAEMLVEFNAIAEILKNKSDLQAMADAYNQQIKL